MSDSSKYRNIFFDLDRTLWDFETNSQQTLYEIMQIYVPEVVTNFDAFLQTYKQINEELWKQYREGSIAKQDLRQNRFNNTFKALNIIVPNSVCKKIDEQYISESPLKTVVFPNTYNVLDYLKNKKYNLHLITNGFIEVQEKKIRNCKLEPYFKKMITSDEAGYQKPDKRIFEYALKCTNSKKVESLMIGDDTETDIKGANLFGMHSVLFNPTRKKHNAKPTFEIDNLADLMQIL